MRAEILLWYCLARRQYGTVSVTADWECAAVALWSELRTYALNTWFKGRKAKAYA